MSTKNVKILFLVFAIILLSIWSASCGGNKPTDQPDNGTSGDVEENGRIVIPDTDWEDSGINDEDEEEDPSEDDPDDGSGDEPTQQIIGDIQIELLFEGHVHPFIQPLVLEDGRYEIVFHVTTSGIELHRFFISSAALPDIPVEGDLSGFDATIPYRFTYNKQTWGDWGIIFSVVNKAGNEIFKQVFILAPESLIPEFR